MKHFITAWFVFQILIVVAGLDALSDQVDGYEKLSCRGYTKEINTGVTDAVVTLALPLVTLSKELPTMQKHKMLCQLNELGV